MGERGNIVIRYKHSNPPGTKIFFYTHWGGYRLKETLVAALERGVGRWDDEAYLARIIFSEMIKDEVLEETGYGIAPYECDNSYPLLIVNMKNATVTENDNTWEFVDFVDKFRAMPESPPS